MDQETQEVQDGKGLCSQNMVMLDKGEYPSESSFKSAIREAIKEIRGEGKEGSVVIILEKEGQVLRIGVRLAPEVPDEVFISLSRLNSEGQEEGIAYAEFCVGVSISFLRLSHNMLELLKRFERLDPACWQTALELSSLHGPRTLTLARDLVMSRRASGWGNFQLKLLF